MLDNETAVVYDFRSRFGLGLTDVHEKIGWRETCLLVSALMGDPSSFLQASARGWSHPISYEWPVVAATYDLLAQVNSKRKPKPYPRPWPKDSQSKKGTARKDGRDILARARKGEFKWQNRRMPTSP